MLLLYSRKESIVSEVSKETAKTTLKLLLPFYFPIQLSLAALFWNWKKHIETKLYLFLSVAYCTLIFPCFGGVYLWASVILQGQISLHNASQPTTKATGCEILLYVVLYSTRSWYISRKNGLVRNGYSFLSHEYSFFNVIVSRLIPLGLCPLKPYQGSPSDTNLQLQSLFNSFFIYKT